MNEKELSLFKLILSGDIGSVRFFRLLEKFGDASSVLKAEKKDLMSVEGIGAILSEAIVNSSVSEKAEKELELAKKNNISVVLYTDSNYPKPLRELPGKPLVLYIKGTILEKDFESISIVGSRKISNYGKTVTSDFASYFAKKDITIVSGLARGVDTLAHITALENKSRTIAVLGNGILVNYPPENKKLQEAISQNGAVISEFPLKQSPDKGTFPRRNRIIAGLSKATLLTEAGIGSGATITARFCAEYGKDVFAVPGSIYSTVSKGTNDLIQNGACIALSPQNMAQQLGWLTKNELKKQIGLGCLDKLETAILNLIENDSDGLPTDLIAEKLNLDISETSAALLKLEVTGLIKNTPGQIYIRAY
ncbi:DNA-processing protein DprA [Candidatus Endomicrobiellum devescovinae]|jgi:DNA processing protein|uniref:DNA-processing protein DprA n=1 Tax=Candidatus Endomicrobiellum devescovinae TaxID=3242322 RepID=UPI002833C604|nr:DNA-processing protein DprA [Endomicrobium sp.]